MESRPRKTKALLLAGGLGTRLRPLTDTTPKCLVEVGGRPLLFHWVEKLEKAGISEALINTHHLPDQVRAAIASINRKGCLTVTESYEPKLLGSAGTVRANSNFANDCDRVLIIYADNFSTVDLNQLLAYHETHDLGFTMTLFPTLNPRACGIAEIDSRDTVVGFVEKPESPTSDLANSGLYVWDTQVYREIALMNAHDIAYDVVPCFVGKMRGYRFDGFHQDIGTMEALATAREYARKLCGGGT